MTLVKILKGELKEWRKLTKGEFMRLGVEAKGDPGGRVRVRAKHPENSGRMEVEKMGLMDHRMSWIRGAKEPHRGACPPSHVSARP